MTLLPRSSFFDIDRFFDSAGFPVLREESSTGTFFSPRVDIVDRDKHYEITAEMPGIKKDDLDVTLNDNVLTISAESTQENNQEQDGKIIRQERRYGKFMRSFNLGEDIDEKAITAAFDNGVLTLTAPKAEPQSPQSQRIPIQ